MRALLIYCIILFTPFAVFAEQVPDSNYSTAHAEKKRSLPMQTILPNGELKKAPGYFGI